MPKARIVGVVSRQGKVPAPLAAGAEKVEIARKLAGITSPFDAGSFSQSATAGASFDNQVWSIHAGS